MNSNRCFLALLFALLVFAGCTSTPNEGAPLADEAHPVGWLADHGQEALVDLRSCQSCHGTDFAGGTVEVSCFTCHLSGPPFTAHPASWGNDTVDRHRNFADELSWTSCATSGCHGLDLKGGVFDGVEVGPSCFTLSGCHNTANNGPPAPTTGPAIHTLNYAEPTGHGPDAKQNQLLCRNCHGLPPNIFDGGFVTPNYDGVGNCSLCHPDAKAHPTDWQGTNDTNANGYTAIHWGVTLAAVEISCSLCHNVSGATPTSPMIGAPTCFDASFENANNQGLIACHAGGPPGHDANAFVRAGTCSDCHSDGGLGIVAGDHKGDCLNCHVSDTDRTRRVGINGDATLADLLVDPETASCLTCHDPAVFPTDAFHHVHAEYAAGNCTFCHVGGAPSHPADFAASSGGCEACHSNLLNVVNVIHAGQCTTCHDNVAGGLGTTIVGDPTNGVDGDATLADGTAAAGSWGTVTCLTCHPAITYPATAIHHDHTEFLAGNCTFCHAGGVPGHPVDFAPSSGGCEACHSDALNVVTDIHGAQCTLCHASATGSATNEIVGVNGDGDATLADGTAAGGTWASVTCQTCHIGLGVNLIPDIHHDNTSPGAGPLAAIAGDCVFCHADPRPQLNFDFGLGSPPSMTVPALACQECHTVGGNIYLNTYTPTSPTNASGGTIATNFATVQQTIMDGNGGTVNHSFATTIQSFGACLTCHLANVTAIYGTSAVKVNVFHARPLNWSNTIPTNDTDDTGADDQTEVLRGAPGRETFRTFGDDQNYWPLGDLRGQGWDLCGGDVVNNGSYDACINNDLRWRSQGLRNTQGDWDIPMPGFDLMMSVPCGNWNDDGTREYCTGVIGAGGAGTRSVPRF